MTSTHQSPPINPGRATPTVRMLCTTALAAGLWLCPVWDAQPAQAPVKTTASQEYVTIGISKVKMAAVTLGAIGFVALSYAIWPGKYLAKRELILLEKGAMIATQAIFGFLVVYGLLKLFDPKPELIINQDGIFDLSSGCLIKWTDIRGFNGLAENITAYCLLIFVHNPQDYLDRASGLTRLQMKIYYKMYGTPLLIPTACLQGGLLELLLKIQTAAPPNLL